MKDKKETERVKDIVTTLAIAALVFCGMLNFTQKTVLAETTAITPSAAYIVEEPGK